MWKTVDGAFEANRLVAKSTVPAPVVAMLWGAEGKRLAVATASGALGKAMKLEVLPGGTLQSAPPRSRSASNGGGRARAEQDPIVKHLQEKVGAEIRTIIDQRDKKEKEERQGRGQSSAADVTRQTAV